MAEATFHFPRGFLWGTGTSSHQVEGNNTNNNWWGWEQEEGNILNGHTSGPACDWWGGRWREDLDRAAESDHNAHRLSIEWSRVQPSPDHWDESVLDRYREIVRGLSERGMTPIVTLHHFSDPLWLAEIGGWENPSVSEYFTAYTKRVVDGLKEYANYWITINEPNVFATNGYLLGIFPPGKRNLPSTINVMTNLVRAHAGAYHTIHSIQPTSRVGAAHNYRGFVPFRSWSPFDRAAAGLLASQFNNFFPRAFTDGVLRFPAWFKRIQAAKGTQDFLGINYYTRDMVAFNLLKTNSLFVRRFYKPDDELSDNKFIANTSQFMFTALKWGTQFDIPIIITENGVENLNDQLRRKYLIQHLHQVWRAVNFNFPVKGYFHWTLVDNFEWERGWTQRFGLWELDLLTQARRKRLSADLFAEICRQNCLSSDMVARYAPEIYKEMFPG
ncbi:MAG: family 1 glycosylhydrolase [Anaerolineales bacterium]